MDLNPFTLDLLKCTEMLSPEIDNKPNMTSLKRRHLLTQERIESSQLYYITMQEFLMIRQVTNKCAITFKDQRRLTSHLYS